MQYTYMQSMCISACAIYSFELYSCDRTSRRPSHALSSGLYSADPLTDNIYKQILCYSQQSDKQIYHKQTFSPAWLVVTLTDTLCAAPAPLAWETPLRAWTMKV